MTEKPSFRGLQGYDWASLRQIPAFFGGYEQQVATAMAIASTAIRQKSFLLTLTFGLPGSGKRTFPQYIASRLVKNDIKINFLRVLANVLLTQRDISQILEAIESEIKSVDSAGCIIGFENIELMIARRTGGALSFADLVVTVLDTIKDFTSDQGVGTAAFLTVAIPSQVDESVLSRTNYVIYFPPPDLAQVKLILQYFKVPDPDRVAEALHTKLEGGLLSAGGLINACQNISRLKIRYTKDIWKNADLLLANAVLFQPHQTVSEFIQKNQYFIQKSQDDMNFWNQFSKKRHDS